MEPTDLVSVVNGTLRLEEALPPPQPEPTDLASVVNGTHARSKPGSAFHPRREVGGLFLLGISSSHRVPFTRETSSRGSFHKSEIVQ